MTTEKPHSYEPPPISGYRPLSQAQVNLINEIKDEGHRLRALVDRVVEHLEAESRERLDGLPVAPQAATQRQAEAMRAAAIARTDLQTGLMWLARAVAQPGGF